MRRIFLDLDDVVKKSYATFSLQKYGCVLPGYKKDLYGYSQYSEDLDIYFRDWGNIPLYEGMVDLIHDLKPYYHITVLSYCNLLEEAEAKHQFCQVLGIDSIVSDYLTSQAKTSHLDVGDILIDDKAKNLYPRRGTGILMNRGLYRDQYLPEEIITVSTTDELRHILLSGVSKAQETNILPQELASLLFTPFSSEKELRQLLEHLGYVLILDNLLEKKLLFFRNEKYFTARYQTYTTVAGSYVYKIIDIVSNEVV